MSESATASDLRYENGKVLRNIGGVDQVCAVFNEKTGRLEFQDEDAAYKLREGIFSAIGTTGDKSHPKDSGRVIKSIALKGVAEDLPTPGEPKRPSPGNFLGDCRPSLVRWMFEYRPHEAYIVYRVRMDKSGKPVRADVRRKRYLHGDAGSPAEVGEGYKRGSSGSWLTTSAQGGAEVDADGNRLFVYESYKNQIIAGRATCMTFLPNEVIGGASLIDPEVDDSKELDDMQPKGGGFRPVVDEGGES